MAARISIKRGWDDTLIKVVIDDDHVAIEAPIDAFQRRLEKAIIDKLPSLSLTFASSSINEKVREAFQQAFAQVTREMKEETLAVMPQKK